MEQKISKIKDCNLREAISCEKSTSVLEVAKKLRDNEERHIIVTEEGRPIGLISNTDINNRLVAEEKDPKSTTAEEIMTKKILVKDIEESLAKAYVDMLGNNIFSCPVTEEGKLKGTLDLKEAMNHLATKIKPQE